MLDVRTLFFIQTLIFLVCTVILIQVWLNHKNRFRGIEFWALMMGALTLGVFLISIRGDEPARIGILFTNLAIFIAIVSFYVGIRLFFKSSGKKLFSFIIVFISMLPSVFFTYVRESIDARAITINLLYILVYTLSLHFIWTRIDKEVRSKMFDLIFNMISIVVINFIRFLFLVISPAVSENVFNSNRFETVYMVANLLALLFLVLNLSLLVSKMLYADVKSEENKFNSLFYYAPYGSIISGLRDGKILEVNDDLLKFMDYTREEIVGKSVIDLNVWGSLEQRSEIVRKLLNHEIVDGMEFQFRGKNGKEVRVLFSAVLIKIDGQDYIMSSLKDITELSKMRENLQYLATHDFLTHLPNRNLFEQFFEESKKVINQTGQSIAVAMIDLDDFKKINDHYGHNTGDKVIKAMAKRLEVAVKDEGIVTRYGGDEFALIWIGDTNRLELSLKDIHAVLIEPLDIEGEIIQMQTSLGVSVFPKDSKQLEELLKMADTRMYQGKKTGKNMIIF
jgi:diguanylate cyclase (GGDEF)-like protein/PAS domain S-box-containing protein